MQLEQAMLEETRRLEDKAKEEKLKQVSRGVQDRVEGAEFKQVSKGVGGCPCGMKEVVVW